MAAAAAGLVFAHGSWVPAAAAQRVGMAHGASMRGVNIARRRGRGFQGRFGLMFPGLPAFEPALVLTDALAATMRDPAAGSETGDNNEVPSGFTFLGQFIDHDLTMDREPLGNQQADPDGATNFRSPLLNLDTLYRPVQPDGFSPGAVRDGAKLLLVENENGVLDLPRNEDGTAKLGDPRNEENLLICQLHIAFARFHNRLVDEGHTFAQARRITTQHYQWVIVNDFLPHIIGQDRVDEVIEYRRNGKVRINTRFYRPRNVNRVYTPLEFSVAAFRFGHSQVRNNYNPNLNIRVAIQQPVAGPGNLNGFRPIPATHVMDMRSFYHFADSPNPAIPPLFNSTRRMDAVISPNLMNLPVQSLPSAPDRTSLPARNLQRGVQVGLPSGQDVARELGVPVLDNNVLAPGADVLADPGFGGECPLWFYLLAESAVTENGVRLGPVGSTIVAETIAGILAADQDSYFNERGWEPMTSTFRMQEFLSFAGVGGII